SPQSGNPRSAFSAFLYRLGDGWSTSERSNRNLQSEARYVMGWGIWHEKLSAAVRSASAAMSEPTKAESLDVLRALSSAYRPKALGTAYLAESDLTTLFDLYTYLANSPVANRGLLKEAVRLRALLLKRNGVVAPTPHLLVAAAKIMASNQPHSAAKLYLQASHDYSRDGELDLAEETLRRALDLSAVVSHSKLMLSPGQRVLVGLIGTLNGNRSPKIELKSSGTAPCTTLDSVHLSNDRRFYRLTFPEPLSEG